MTSLPSGPLMSIWVMIWCLACLWRAGQHALPTTTSLESNTELAAQWKLSQQKDKPTHRVPLQSGSPLSWLFSLGKCFFSASPGKPALTLVGIIAPLTCMLHKAVSITPAPSDTPVPSQWLPDGFHQWKTAIWESTLIKPGTLLRLFLTGCLFLSSPKCYEAAITLSIFKIKKLQLRKVKVMCPSSQLTTQVCNEANHPWALCSSAAWMDANDQL